MSQERSRFVMAPEWLAANLGNGVKIVDASWYLPAQGRDARAEYEAAHIPGAVFFDQDEIVARGATLPHMLPSPEEFAGHAGKLGLSTDDRIVVYDGPGLFSAPRVWWVLRTMGASDVSILDGGMDQWKAAGLPTTSDKTIVTPGTFKPHFDEQAVSTLTDMRGIVERGDVQIVDARSAGRFTGEEPEPRAGMRSGHMPGAFNLPFNALAENGRLKSLAGLREAFAQAGVDLERPVATSCGSGVTAAVLTLGLQSLTHEDNTLYDGSWSEWGGLADTPVEVGPSGKGGSGA